MKKKAIYALYKGDTFIDLGTIDYLANILNVSVRTAKFYKSPVYHKRCKDNALIIIRIED